MDLHLLIDILWPDNSHRSFTLPVTPISDVSESLRRERQRIEQFSHTYGMTLAEAVATIDLTEAQS